MKASAPDVSFRQSGPSSEHDDDNRPGLGSPLWQDRGHPRGGGALRRRLAETTDPRSGILYHTLLSPLSAGTAARYLEGYDGGRARSQLVVHRGEHVVLLWYGHASGQAVRCIIRSEIQSAAESRISRLRIYYFSPELLTDVTGELGVPVRTNGRGLD